jgi:hypothetical protein
VQNVSLIRTIEIFLRDKYHDKQKIEIEEMCKDNVETALKSHMLDCPGRNNKKKNAINYTSFIASMGLVLEKIAESLWHK